MSEQPEVVVAETARAEVVPSAASMEVTRTEPAEPSTQIVEHRTESPQAAQWRLRNTIAGRLVNTDFVPEAYRGKPDQVLACLAYGDEIGLGAMQSLQSIDVIKGKPTLKPETMRAMILGAGHSLVRVAASDTEVTFHGKRRDNGGEETVTFTFEQAKQLGLTGKDNWTKQPKAMLTARCTGEIARSLFPDVIRGASYTPEEMGDDSHGEPEGPIPMDEVPEPPLRIVTRDHRDAGKVVSGTGVNPENVLDAGPEPWVRSSPTPGFIPTMPPDGAGAPEPEPFKGWPYSYVTNADGFNIRTCNACTHPTDQHSEIRRGCTICACRNTFPPQPDDDASGPPRPPHVVAEASASDSAATPPAAGSEAAPLPTSTFRAVHAALRDCGFGDDERHVLIGWVTNGRTDSSKGLTADDAEVLLNLLGKVKSGTIQVQVGYGMDEDPLTLTATNDRGVAFLRGLATRV